MEYRYSFAYMSISSMYRASVYIEEQSTSSDIGRCKPLCGSVGGLALGKYRTYMLLLQCCLRTLILHMYPGLCRFSICYPIWLMILCRIPLRIHIVPMNHNVEPKLAAISARNEVSNPELASNTFTLQPPCCFWFHQCC